MSQNKSSQAGVVKPRSSGKVNEARSRVADLTADIGRGKSGGQGSNSVMNTHKPPEPIVGKKGK